MELKNVFLHLKKILVHKYWVNAFCCRAGMPVRGFFHDMSKFSPTEFWEGAKYYQGTRSPIDACKDVHGWSAAWQHHKGRNKHHYQYWIDNHDGGGVPLRVPYEYAVEMLCDYLGAAKAYMGKNFSYAAEWDWWENKVRSCPNMMMHKDTKRFITVCLRKLKKYEADPDFDYDGAWFFEMEDLKQIYDNCIEIGFQRN